jgi:hypothetical protein
MNDVIKPFYVFVKLLSTIPLNILTVKTGNPLTPQTGLRGGRVIVFNNTWVMVLTPKTQTTNEILPKPTYRKADNVSNVVFKQPSLILVPLHAAGFRKLGQVMRMLSGKWTVKFKLSVKFSAISHF